jgi:prophage regulatory protein
MTKKETKSVWLEHAPLIMRKKQVLATVGLSASTVYQMQKAGKFPLPVKLSARATGWLSSDIEAWLTNKAEERVA